jgi:hypothetical protein
VEGSSDAGDVLAVSSLSKGTVALAAANTTSSAQDWAPVAEGIVSNAATAGVLSSRLDMLYSGDALVEYQYAPDGIPSGQCLADGSAQSAVDGEDTFTFNYPSTSVVLGQCGLTAQTLWIVDGNNESNGYVDLISAGYESVYSYGNFAPQPYTSGLGVASSDQDAQNLVTSPFAEPYVLTVNNSGTVVLATLSDVGSVSSAQMWSGWSSPDQSDLRTKAAAEAAAASGSS